MHSYSKINQKVHNWATPYMSRQSSQQNVERRKLDVGETGSCCDSSTTTTSLPASVSATRATSGDSLSCGSWQRPLRSSYSSFSSAQCLFDWSACHNKYKPQPRLSLLHPSSSKHWSRTSYRSSQRIMAPKSFRWRMTLPIAWFTARDACCRYHLSPLRTCIKNEPTQRAPE